MKIILKILVIFYLKSTVLFWRTRNQIFPLILMSWELFLLARHFLLLPSVSSFRFESLLKSAVAKNGQKKELEGSYLEISRPFILSIRSPQRPRRKERRTRRRWTRIWLERQQRQRRRSWFAPWWANATCRRNKVSKVYHERNQGDCF